MAENLRPEGIPVTIGTVRISTPGLTGRVEVYQPGTAGMRGAESSTEAFRRIQKLSMDTRKSMKDVAEAILLAHQATKSG